MPSSRKRSHQRQTVGFDFPVRRMVRAGPQPEPSSRMMRARQTCFCMLRGLPMICSRRACSSPDSLISCLVDFLPIGLFLVIGRVAAGGQYHDSGRHGLSCIELTTSVSSQWS